MNLQTDLVNNGRYKVEVIRGDSYIGPTIRSGYEWDGWMRRDIDNFYRPGSDIIDIGGNIGYNTLMFSDYGNVHTFEPLYQEIINRNLKHNNPKHSVCVHPYALGSKNTFSTIFIPKPLQNSTINFGNSSMVPTKDHSNISMPVAVKTLDTVYKGIPSLIKIDVEGYELEVLKGSEETLKKFFPTLLIEIHEIQNSEIPDYLNKLGYRFVHPRPEHMYVFSLKNWEHVSVDNHGTN